MRERSREPPARALPRPPGRSSGAALNRTLPVNANSLDIYEHVYVINFYDGSDNGIGGAIRLSRRRCLA